MAGDKKAAAQTEIVNKDLEAQQGQIAKLGEQIALQSKALAELRLEKEELIKALDKAKARELPDAHVAVPVVINDRANTVLMVLASAARPEEAGKTPADILERILSDAKEDAQELEQLNAELLAKVAELSAIRNSVDQRKGGIKTAESKNYPKPAKDVRDATGKIIALADPVEQQRAARWREQGRIKCKHARCHHPLQPVFKEGTRDEVKIETVEGPGVLAVCTYDPGHKLDGDKPQYILDEQRKPAWSSAGDSE